MLSFTNQNCKIEYYQDNNEIILESLEVHPEYRRQGQATTTLREFIQFIEEQKDELNVNTIGLYADPQEDNIEVDELIEFYEYIGFDEDGDVKGLMEYTL